jgi:hypothetical protein
MNEAQRQEFLVLSRAHYAADMLVQGTYGSDESGAFRGCSVGCHVHHISSSYRGVSHHAAIAGHYGYPEWLVRLQDTIFEGLPRIECNRWHVQLAGTLYTLPDDYDWQAAMHRVLVATLRVALPHAGTAAPVVQAVIILHERAARGEAVTEEEWTKAAEAATKAVEAATKAATWAALEVVRAALEVVRAATKVAEVAARAAAGAAAEAARAAEWAAEATRMAYQQIRDGVLTALAQTGEKS